MRPNRTKPPDTGFRRLGLYLNTLRHLRPSQLAYLAWRRLGPRPAPRAIDAAPKINRSFQFAGGLALPGSVATADSFRFLNETKSVDAEGIDWRADDMPKLWRYNLHYFDFIHSESCSPAHAALLIDDWIENNPPGRGDGWEPYPTSLRIVNWIKFFAVSNAENEQWHRSLCTQCDFLGRSLERDILANHYLKNAKALVFAGAYCEGDRAADWLARGSDIFETQIREQVLPDGGHFERSLMYHAIIAEDLLDILNLAGSNTGVLAEAAADRLRSTAHRMLYFLETVRYPDGEIPLFNDAAFEIAPLPDAILAYGETVAGYKPMRREALPDPIAFSDTGYVGHRSGSDMLLMDCGPIGPEYQPGHGHCDMLSYELVLDGARVVVDSGVADYEVGPTRDYVRGTAGHNTVLVDGVEQSEVWGVFRVARRAQAGEARIESRPDGRVALSGGYEVCRPVGGERVRHERTIEYANGAWRIEDSLAGQGTHTIENFVHLHPDYSAMHADGEVRIETAAGRCVAVVRPESDCHVTLEKGYYCPKFGQIKENDVIVMNKAGKFPIQMAYQINKVSS